MLQGFDEYLARGAEEALGEDGGECDTCGAEYPVWSREGRCGDCGECAEHCTHLVACAGTCTCGAECLIVEEAPKPKYEFYSLIYGNKLGEV